MIKALHVDNFVYGYIRDCTMHLTATVFGYNVRAECIHQCTPSPTVSTNRVSHDDLTDSLDATN